jgi:hypothetical protein
MQLGTLHCQRNSFSRSLSNVACLNCQAVPSQKLKNSSLRSKLDSVQVVFCVELEDTALFPEGGGQVFAPAHTD